MVYIIKIIIANILSLIYRYFIQLFRPKNVVHAEEAIPLKTLIDKIIVFCEVYSGVMYYPYQEQFARRIVRSILLNDGEEITALFSRQAGKSETVATTVGGCMIILPILAQMFPNDERLQMFKDGLWVGIFAPSERQAKITYNRLRKRLNSKSAQAILEDPSINLTFNVSNGQNVSLSNNSFASAISASEGSNIEGESFKLIICEECFVKGTRVLTNNGYVNIEHLKAGDIVMSYNEKSGKVENKVVERSFSQPLYNRKIVTITTESGRKIICTDNHKIYLPDREKYFRADSLQTGDFVFKYSSGGVHKEEIVIIEIETLPETEVYDITVSDNHNFFANDILVHNCQDISNYKIQKCLTGDTRVLLADGTYKRLDTIVRDKKDTVVCYDTNMKYLTSKLPSEFYDNGEQDVYLIKLDNGDSIKATLNHQFYTYDQKTNGTKLRFRTVETIMKSMNNSRPIRIGVPNQLPYFAENKEFDYERGQIIGYFLGDGCMRGTPKFIGDIPTNKYLHSLIKECVDPDIQMTEYHYNPDNAMQEVCFSTPTNKKNSNTLTQFLKSMEVYDLVGADKKLPDRLYSSEFYMGLIMGLIETDGCIESCTTKPIISFANISKDLVYQLKEILLKFGIHSTINVVDNTGGFSKNSKPLYRLHIKSSVDIKQFYDYITLFRKQVYLNEAYNTVKYKVTRERSKYYPSTMRFCKVKSIEYAGVEHTYCLKVEGRNFIANNIISSNSIHPMGAAYNATIVKVGTATTFVGDFYEAIQRNKQTYLERKQVKNHFEYDWKVVVKYNKSYAKYIEKEKKRLGETSDAFQMSYGLKWILVRGMFVSPSSFEKKNIDTSRSVVPYDKSGEKTYVAALDQAKHFDGSVLTICEVDWSNPVIHEVSTNDDGTENEFTAYDTTAVAWYEYQGDYNDQYYQIMDDLANYSNLVRLVCDATREESQVDRLKASLDCEVIDFKFTPENKSMVYKTLDREIKSGRAKIVGDELVQESIEFKKMQEQLYGLQKNYKGTRMVVANSSEKVHDDYPDSWAMCVWGCSTKQETTVARTEGENPMFARSKSEFYVRRNRLTSRRR